MSGHSHAGDVKFGPFSVFCGALEVLFIHRTWDGDAAAEGMFEFH